MGASDTDPTQATSADLDRRSFVGMSAAATTGLGTAITQPPIVPENDPSISVDRVELRRPDVVVKAYAAWPAHIRPPTPSVVVIQHIWGVDTSIREFVRRLAKAGFAAIAPDLFARLNAPSGDGSTDIDTFRPLAKQLDRKVYDGDIRAAALWCTTKFANTKVAILGFCMGGHIALVQAVDNNDVFAAVVPFYGAVNDINPDNIHMPVCGSYGARDTSISAEDVRAFRQELRVPNDIRIYNSAGHAFMDNHRPSYVPAAAADAWKRTVDFLEKYIGHQGL